MAAGGRGRLGPGAGPVLAAQPRAGALTFGQPIYRHASLDSTQSLARTLAEAGAPEGATVVAGQQTGGRGRLGSTFHSPLGGLYLSIVLRPSLAPASAPLIGLALGLAVAEAVHAVTGLQPLLKWPNDVLIGGRKLSGVLVDLTASKDAIRWAIAGVGVNANIASFPPELAEIATSLQIEMARQTNLEALRTELLARFEGRYRALTTGGAEALLDAWSAAPNLLGRRVRAALDGELCDGVAERLDPDGALVLRLVGGDTRRIVAADVHLLPATRTPAVG